MTDNWLRTTLGKVLELKRGYDLPQRQRKPGSVPVVSSSGISDFHAEAKVKGPGVVTGRYGTIGEVYYIEEDFWPHNTTLYVRDFKGNDPRFISYFLQTIHFSAYSDKAAVPGINRNHLHLAEITIPPLSEQKSIAAVLSAFDDKIELNGQMNATLEEIGRALFKSWFVDFDPVRRNQTRQPSQPYDHLFPDKLVVDENGRERPEGWQAKPLDEIADYQNGLALQKFPPEEEVFLPVIKIRELRQGFADANSNKASSQIKESCILYDGDVVFSWSGSLLVDLWCGGKGALNQHLFKVTSAAYPKWFYYYWTKHHLDEFQRIAAGKATTMGHIQRKHLSSAEAAVPPRETLNILTRIMKPLVERVIANRLESRTLADLRDILLPRLMSGRLRVGQFDELSHKVV